jgi:hypothetical protein
MKIPIYLFTLQLLHEKFSEINGDTFGRSAWPGKAVAAGPFEGPSFDFSCYNTKRPPFHRTDNNSFAPRLILWETHMNARSPEI